MAIELLIRVLRRQAAGIRLGGARRLACFAAMCLLSAHALLGSNADHKVLIRDVTQIEGVRDNQLVGYGLVIGLTRTGDTQQTFFTVQTLANTLQRMGVQIAPGVVVVNCLHCGRRSEH